ncbi:MAG: GTPase HflX [candidate division WOR-3 bacterium]
MTGNLDRREARWPAASVTDEQTSFVNRALLIGLATSSKLRWAKVDSLEELSALARTAGGIVVEKLVQVRPRPDPATFVGSGMVEQLRQLCRQHLIDLLIFDDELTPTQQRNLEAAVGVRVVDRTALILDIFAIHARTAEAKIQVELAQLEYRQSRLTGFGAEMSRLGGIKGGIGARGPGETQLEVDRRRIRHRIASLRHSLSRIDRERETQRRRRQELFQVVLVGYTNAGKSTLFNQLTNAGVMVSNRLFATLDPNTKPLDLDPHVRVVLTDTVGFIRSLPHQLVASFRSTLAEVREADLLLHVADATEEHLERQIDAVNDTLAEVGAKDKPVLVVFSKVDRVFDDAVLDRLRRNYAGAQFVSGKTGLGIQELKRELLGRVRRQMRTRTFTIPDTRWDLISLVRDSGRVLREEALDGKRRLVVSGFEAALGRARKALDAAIRRR